MNVNAHRFLALVVASLALILLVGSWSIAFATKPVPLSESKECQKARADHAWAKEKYQHHKAKWSQEKHEADAYNGKASRCRDLYMKNCQHKPLGGADKCNALLRECKMYETQREEHRRWSDWYKAEGAKTNEEVLRIGNWYRQNCKGGYESRPPGDENRSQQVGKWKCWSGQGRNGFCIKNGCHPEECYWQNSVTGEKKYDHQPEPPGGWIK